MTGEQNNSTNCRISPVMSAKQDHKANLSDDKPTTVKDWGYNQDDCGPQNWPVVCGTGKKGQFCTLASQLLQQSPIDLQLTGQHIMKLAAKEPLKFVNYGQMFAGEMANTGHSVQFIPEARIDAAEIYGGQLDQNYRFIQYHYHWSQNDNDGSEHTLCGKYFPAELHLVHQGVEDPSKLAVLGVFLQLEDNEAKALEEDAKFLSRIQEYPQKTRVQGQQLQCKLPHNLDSFVRYQGSLTTPPCSENVIWTVFIEPVAVSKEQAVTIYLQTFIRSLGEVDRHFHHFNWSTIRLDDKSARASQHHVVATSLNLLRSIKDCNGGVIHKNCRPVQQLNHRNLFVCGC